MIVKKKRQYIMGIDASINGTGVVIIDTNLNIVKKLHFKFNSNKNHYEVGGKTLKLINNNKNLRGLTVAKEIGKLIRKYNPKVLIEDYAPDGNGLILQIAEFTGAIKNEIYRLGHNIELVAIKTLKKKITGNGAASKRLVRHALEKEVGFSFEENDDLNDAYSLALIGAKRF